ncbi:PREDICTED: ninja-family protein AFP4-like isoform X2 [Brassica oleracea var. oleracea]|uniref:Ninja-family protein n=2 Tax=Brassica oleracea var. oleracea TaxID=109376 RepID=A0A0D3B9C8_BRAOL|nr:PREDICTED: ninja-family protein AFP4-like isoform X2 [Brassica oleracea var. oleracea]
MEMLRARGSSTNGVVQVPNLLGKFFVTSNHFCHRDSEHGERREEAKKKDEEEEEEEEGKDIELTLGLSLNGQFGTDPRSRKRKNFELARSSSIPEGFVFDGQRSGGDMRQTVERGVSDMFQLDRTRSLPAETETEAKRKRPEKTKVQAEEKPFLSFNVPPLPTKEKGEKDGFLVSAPVSGRGENGNTAKKKNQEVSGMEKARNILEDMPCVSTRDVGADGKRVEGFLYWYGGSKEEVKIVCVCHGSFLSPAEFVRHGGGTVSDGGGGDVTSNPLRDIVVKLPSSSL